ncbi:MAG: ABC transporter substrate-binding protein, partial [Oscillospiraceae bacterium]
MSKKILSLVLCICMLTGVLSGCDGEKTQGKESETEKATAKTLIPEEKQGGILNVALSAVPASLDPIKYTSVYESQIICMVCDTLLCYNSDMALSPSLATQWKANEAGDVYTFTLRDDVYFQKGKYQDGRKMTAEDVKYSLERSAKESALQRLSMLDYCQVISDTEIECHLKSPNASFLSALNNGGNVIIPKEEAEGWGDGFSAHLVGTGP